MSQTDKVMGLYDVKCPNPNPNPNPNPDPKVLGLHDVKYRAEIKSMFREFKKNANSTLKDTYDSKKALVKSW